MAAQQIQIAETIRAMKIAFKRRPDDSDSEDDFQPQTNRGNKLKRSARYVREGRLDNTGRLAYKRRVNYAGYTRSIISTNPPLYDSEGEPASPQSSSDERVLQPLDDDPFAGTQLEILLKPLTSLEELADHPSLGEVYKESALTQMATEAAKMLREERENLWKAKRLLRRFQGDADWAPCAVFETEADSDLWEHHKDAMNGTTGIIHDSTDEPSIVQDNADRDAMQHDNPDAQHLTSNGIKAEDMAQDLSGVEEATEGESKNPQLDGMDESRDSIEPHSETASTSASHMHAMTTRARARSPQHSTSPSPSLSDSASAPVIHPWYLTPTTSLPDRDLGLPPDEAETTRKMLLLYCQKQEQIIQALDALYSGLQRGDRLRKFVLTSTKAAGHLVLDGKNGLVTEMSDGEDWYDSVEFGRLEKGKDEVEDIEEEGRRGGRRRRVVGRV